MRQQQSGFTLIEIAIVLVIIGLLLGGVLKGQELITQAKIKNIANDFNGLTAAVYGYQDRYKALPGDDNGASTRWTMTVTTTGGTFGDNKIDGAYSAASPSESALFWQELRLAGFVTGDQSSSAQPLNAAGGITGVEMGTSSKLTVTSAAGVTTGLIGTLICSGSLSGKIAQAIDSQFDDGNPSTGSVRARTETSPPTTITGAAATAYLDDGSSLYVVCKAL